MNSIVSKLQYICLAATLIVLTSKAQAQSTPTAFPAGSVIIDMGVTPQTIANGLKPYGLLYELLVNKVPVSWAISDTKVKDGVDFTIGTRQFRGGPFVISSVYRTTTVNNILNAWAAKGVQLFYTTAPATLPIYFPLLSQPRWTMDKDNGAIIVKFFKNAEIPASAYGGSSSNWINPSQLTCCNDIFVLPHADPTWATHRKLLEWNSSCKGAIWYGCHAGSAIENMFDNITTDGDPINFNEQTNFLTTKTGPATGAGPYSTKPGNSLTLWKNHKDGTPPYTYLYPTDPVMQFMGILDKATQNGSEQIYIPRSGGWLPGTKAAVYDPDHPQRVGTATNPGTYTEPKHRPAVLAYGRGFDNPNNGWIMVEAGHDIAKLGNDPQSVAAQRAFFNFSFMACADKIVIPTMTIPGTLLNSGNPYAFSVSFPPGQTPETPYTITWSSSCGGTFTATAPNNQAVTFTPPAANTPTICNITVTITDPCGRVSFDTKAVPVQCNTTVNPTITNPCFNTPNGGVISFTSTTPGPYSYTWTRTGGGSGSGSGSSITGLSQGTYTVVATTGGGCQSTFTTTLTQSPQILPVATASPVSCNGGANGSVSLAVSGGIPGYTYSWSPGGATTQNISGLTAGAYNVSVTDGKGCVASTSATVVQPSVISASSTKTDVSCFGGANGSITLTVSGGNGGYSYLWTDGATTQNRTGLSQGTYSVTITDSKGCTTSLTGITIGQPVAALSLSSTQVNTSCFGNSNGSINLTVTGGTSGYTYLWTKTGTAGTYATTEDLSSLGTGTYNVTVTDSKGCTATLSVVISQPTVLSLSTVRTNPTCPPDAQLNGFDGAINLTVSGGTGTKTFVWVASNGGIVPPAQVNNEDLTQLRSGTYTVTVTDANGCTATTSVTLTNTNPKPVQPPVIN